MLLRAATAVALLAWATHESDAAVWRMPLTQHHHHHLHARAFAPSRLADVLHQRHAASWKSSPSKVWQPAFSTEERGEEGPRPVPVDFHADSRELFAATVHVGTPPQPVSVILDIFSADFLVLSHKVGAHTYYDHGKSSTYRANGTRVRMFEGQPFELDGFVSSDRVIVGGADAGDRVDVHGQSLIELDGPARMLDILPFDGAIGLGPSPSNYTGQPTIVRSMIDQKLLDLPVVGVDFGRQDAHVVFGGVDGRYDLQSFQFFAQRAGHADGWSAPLHGIQVNGKQFVHDAHPAVVSNIDDILGPSEVVYALADAVGADNFAIPCDGPGPDVTFRLGSDFEVTLTKQDYAIPREGGMCQFAMTPVPLDLWALGLPFLRRVYTALDFGLGESEPRIGFAAIKTA